uniref:SAM domain-containing protein n=1 Tax=Romanomermis culicivorax TaxID=13658 RepID=A0A915IGK3_ROMCU
MDSQKRISVYEEEFTANSFDIFTAASVGDVDVLKTLLSTDSNQANARNQGGWTALMYAAYIGYEKACKFLLESRANVNEQNCAGQTALMLAASCGNENVCNLLIQNGADISIADNRGWNCLVYSASCNHVPLVKLLLKKNADPNLMYILSSYYLTHGADLYYANKNGDSPKKLAARHNHKQIYRLIENTKQMNNAKKYHKPAEKTVSNPVTSNVYCNDFSLIPPKLIAKEYDNAQLMPDQRNGFTNDSNIQPRMTSTPINNKLCCNQPPQSDDNIKMFHNGTGDKKSDVKECLVQTNGQQHQLKSKSVRRAENLTELFNQLQLAKYRPLFDQQEIDLTLFLQLTDSELKEIGVNSSTRTVWFI